MSREKKCPVCGRNTYQEYEGGYDIGNWGQGRKLTPDQGHCSYCGFFYEEHILHSQKEQVENYKRKWKNYKKEKGDKNETYKSEGDKNE